MALLQSTPLAAFFQLVEAQGTTPPVSRLHEIFAPTMLRRKVMLAPEIADRIAERARRDGISVETLVNLWIGEKLQVAAAT